MDEKRQNRGRIEREIESEDEGDAGGVVEAQENTMNTEVKMEPIVTKFYQIQHLFFSYNLSFIEVGEEERNETTRRFNFRV